MIRTIALTKIAVARVWEGEKVTPGFVADSWLSRTARAGHERAGAPRTLGIDIMLPGPAPRTGLLAIEIEPRAAGVEVHVPVSPEDGEVWDGGVVSRPLDTMRLGLPVEFAPAVLEDLTAAVHGRIESCSVRVVEAAHGRIGSSRDMFGRIARALVAVALTLRPDCDDEVLRESLRGSLFWKAPPT